MKIYVDMDGVLCDYNTAYTQKFDKVLNPYPQSKPGFFLGLEPMPLAKYSMEAMKEAGHDVFILTRPSIKNPHCWSEKAMWIERHLGQEWVKRTIITCRKDLLFDGKAYLIDDVLSSDAGQQVFDAAGKLIWFNERNNWSKIQFSVGADD